ncbi:hypothetical protein SKAU_G00003350 [Synaphobranchus kaupii]|uniref:Uncharacterized protein n=1 Tax=Synaphobranchus kaupii TaxID=118154 RepID=A0A9Q1JCM5_SYNKA|nr:hypothetical protein SKAU_G00003350 [Synaphobranchus kaupii]
MWNASVSRDAASVAFVRNNASRNEVSPLTCAKIRARGKQRAHIGHAGDGHAQRRSGKCSVPIFSRGAGVTLVRSTALACLPALPSIKRLCPAQRAAADAQRRGRGTRGRRGSLDRAPL